MKIEKIVVSSAPELGREDEAAAQLLALAATLRSEAQRAVSEALQMTEQATLIEQFTRLVEGDELVKIRDAFVEEGVLEITTSDLDVNAFGGDA